MKITASNTQQAVQNLAKNTNQAFQENVKISELGQKLPEIATFFQK